ncbi:hypothetical protein PHET_01034 [Paragonimus heterotremus]|uniref:BHLH domain-containing protein n=1 Tax=Paragonimus heterotremus TaxID=100268 RepID=A0A8J4WKM5_9TREM|nr:hypothetical protein PHET_01034 [Paragonimus heterotremus]
MKPLGAGSRHDQSVKSNPSKRHRERLNSELEHLASLLPFEQNVIVKLDKLSILRLAVSYLRMKCYFQAFTYDRLATENRLVSHLYHCPFDLTRIEGEACLQALNGFIFIMSCDGEVFSVSKTVEHFLGFHQTLELSGRLQFLYGQTREKHCAGSQSHHKNSVSTRTNQPNNASSTCSSSGSSSNPLGVNQLNLPALGLFVVCSPLGPLPSLSGSQRDITFKTKHQLDLTVMTIDSRTRMLFSFTDAELQPFKVYDIVHPEDLKYVAQGHREVFKTGSVGLLVHRWLSKSGVWIWLQSRVKLMMKGGKQDHIIAIHRQLSQHEGMELLNRRSDEYKLPFPLLEPETLLSEDGIGGNGRLVSEFNGGFSVAQLKEFETNFLDSIVNGNGKCKTGKVEQQSLQMHETQTVQDKVGSSTFEHELSVARGLKKETYQSSGVHSSMNQRAGGVSKENHLSTRGSSLHSSCSRQSNSPQSGNSRMRLSYGKSGQSKRKKNVQKDNTTPTAELHNYVYPHLQGPFGLSQTIGLRTSENIHHPYGDNYSRPDLCNLESHFQSFNAGRPFTLPHSNVITPNIPDFDYTGNYYFGWRTTDNYPTSQFTQFTNSEQSIPNAFTKNNSTDNMSLIESEAGFHRQFIGSSSSIALRNSVGHLTEDVFDKRTVYPRFEGSQTFSKTTTSRFPNDLITTKLSNGVPHHECNEESKLSTGFHHILNATLFDELKHKSCHLYDGSNATMTFGDEYTRPNHNTNLMNERTEPATFLHRVSGASLSDITSHPISDTTQTQINRTFKQSFADGFKSESLRLDGHKMADCLGEHFKPARESFQVSSWHDHLKPTAPDAYLVKCCTETDEHTGSTDGRHQPENKSTSSPCSSNSSRVHSPETGNLREGFPGLENYHPKISNSFRIGSSNKTHDWLATQNEGVEANNAVFTYGTQQHDRSNTTVLPPDYHFSGTVGPLT